MSKTATMAAAFDRRFGVSELLPAWASRALPSPPKRQPLYGEDFWLQVRVDYTWLSIPEMALRRGVSESTIKDWLGEAFEGRP